MKSTSEQLCVLRDCVMERLIILVRVLPPDGLHIQTLQISWLMIGGDNGVSLGIGEEKKGKVLQKK